jgi:hypothetical protein
MGTNERLERIRQRIDPSRNRDRVISELEALFRTGEVPDPLPHGFHAGTYLTTTIWGPADRLLWRVADLWMPWLGKSFDASTSSGVNRFDASAGIPMRALWPSHRAKRAGVDVLEAFPFRNRVGTGEVDQDLKVYKIDYDFAANPTFIIRHILDEIVQIDDRTFLGRILYRVGTMYHPIGFFALERPA